MDILCYCYNCDKRVDVDIKNELIESNINDIKYQYHGDIAYCKVCNAEVYIRTIDDINIETAHKAYKAALTDKINKGVK